MQVNRIVLALVCAGLAAPAFAEKCSVCDSSDEPIVVKPTKQGGFTTGGRGNDTISGSSGNDPMQRGNWIGAEALPQPATGGAGQRKVTHNEALVFYIGGMPAPRTALTGAASGRPAESQSLNFTKIEYKYMPYDAKGPAVGAMTVRR